MHRPRFIPNNDTLEPRELMSGFNFFKPTTNYNATAAQLSTYQQRQQRITNLPYFLETVSPGRPLPADVVTNIQNDLRSVVGRLGPATSNGLYTYNRNLRGLLADASVNTGNYQPVLTMFTKNLQSTGMPSSTVQSLTSNVRQLAQVGVNTTSNTTSVVANDTSLILELALAVGKPLPAPKLPHLLAADTVPGHAGYTYNPTPTIQGTYEANMTMILTNYQGTRIFGTAPTDSNGNYQITLKQPLTYGNNRLQVVAMGPGGIGSLGSAPLGIALVHKK